MNVQVMSVTVEHAHKALLQYKEHRAVYDKKDWEIERIYRQIAKGKTVISVADAIRGGGLDEQQRPHLAIARADCANCGCRWSGGSNGHFGFYDSGWNQNRWDISIPWPGLTRQFWSGSAQVPRIPPQHRPKTSALRGYHILWEADWKDIPHDPYLLKRIGKDAWVVLAAWDLTEVELSVLRAHQQ